MVPKPVSMPPVPIPRTELLDLASDHTGRRYDIYVGLPADDVREDRLLPVLYVLDGQWDFKLLMSIVGALRFDMVVPDMIVVGITHGGVQPDHEALRASDYTPTAVADHPGSGRAPRLLSFLSDELIPLIEQRYRAEPGNRVLVGSSLGGLFGLYAVFRMPDLFPRCLCVSPVATWDGGAILRSEEAHFASRRDLPVQLFLAAGELESARWMLEPMRELAGRLRGRHYDGFELTEMIISGERHAGVKAEAFTRGLRSLFTQSALAVSEDELACYAGSYRSVDGDGARRLTFGIRQSRLVLVENPGANDPDELIPISPTRFRFHAIPAEITFHRDATGDVTRATLHLQQGDEHLQRTT